MSLWLLCFMHIVILLSSCRLPRQTKSSQSSTDSSSLEETTAEQFIYLLLMHLLFGVRNVYYVVRCQTTLIVASDLAVIEEWCRAPPCHRRMIDSRAITTVLLLLWVSSLCYRRSLDIFQEAAFFFKSAILSGTKLVFSKSGRIWSCWLTPRHIPKAEEGVRLCCSLLFIPNNMQ